MEIPLLDLKGQYGTIKNEVDEVIKQVVESQYFILSSEVSSLEEEIADYCGTSFAAGCNSGTDALILALKAAGVGKGDLVITTPFTFFATGESISVLGATPVFVDIDPDTYNIDPDKIEEALKRPEVKDSAKAIVPVHIYGQCADMTRIMEIAKKHDLKVVEDCAQAIGAYHKDRKAGSFGDAGCLSFFPSKNLGGFGDGGMVVSGEGTLIDHVKRLRVHGSREQYIHEEIGFNSRLDSLQAAILRVKLRKLDEWIAGRQAIAGKYNAALAPLGIKVPVTEEDNTHTYHQYTLSCSDRDGLLEHLHKNNIAARVYYPVPLHLQPCYKDLGYSIGSIPVAEKLCEQVLSLPVYPELSGEQVEYVINTIRDYVS